MARSLKHTTGAPFVELISSGETSVRIWSTPASTAPRTLKDAEFGGEGSIAKRLLVKWISGEVISEKRSGV